VKRLSGTVTAVTGVGGMPVYTLSHSSGRAATLASIWAIVPALAWGENSFGSPFGRKPLSCGGGSLMKTS
jgi:hypothetical protein